MIYSHRFEDGGRLRLEAHIAQVTKVSCQILDGKQLNFSISQHRIRELSCLIASYHDFGKCTRYFQEYLLEKKQHGHKKDHALLSAIAGFLAARQWLSGKEDISKEWAEIIPFLVFFIIERHHGNLEKLEDRIPSTDFAIDQVKERVMSLLEDTWQIQLPKFHFVFADVREEIQRDLNQFCDDLLETLEGGLIDRLQKSLDDAAIERYLLFLLLYSILLEADKAYLALEPQDYRRGTDPPLKDVVDRYRDNTFEKPLPNSMNALRDRAYQEATHAPSKSDISTLTLPTGTGKTLIALSLALKERRELATRLGIRPKIITALPFLSVIEQTEKVYRGVLSEEMEKGGENLFLKYHSLSDYSYRHAGEEDAEDDISKTQFLIETWQAEMILTTFDQVLFALFQTQRHALMRFHNLVNSVLVMDEVQALPYDLWEVIRRFFRVLAKVAHTRILFMTATQPLIFRQEDGVVERISNPSSYFSAFQRVKLLPKLNKQYTVDEFSNEIIQRLGDQPNKSMMVVLNTIRISLTVFEAVRKAYPTRKIFYLSSNIIPRDRLKCIEEIRLSQQNGEAPIVVTTQCVEAGVDLDMDWVIRDLGPLDSIFQVAGRCNRNDEKGCSPVEIFEIADDRERSTHSYIYDAVLMDVTKRLLEKRDAISEKEFFDLGKRYFEGFDKYKNRDRGKRIIEALIGFKYIFEDKPIDIRGLLRGNLPKETVLVIRREEDQRLLNELRNVLAIPVHWERRQALLEIRKAIAEISLSISPEWWSEGEPRRLDQIAERSGPFYYLEGDRFYDPVVGFKRETRLPSSLIL
jgi:CRISPR-associated endonuclease/helicase Cas3